MRTDGFLNEMAKAMGGESYAYISHFMVGTNNYTPAVTDTALTGEFGSRFAVSRSRSANVLTLTGTRSGAVVTSTSGDVLYTFGDATASSGGVFTGGVVLPALTQTTSYDIEWELQLTVNRR